MMDPAPRFCPLGWSMTFVKIIKRHEAIIFFFWCTYAQEQNRGQGLFFFFSSVSYQTSKDETQGTQLVSVTSRPKRPQTPYKPKQPLLPQQPCPPIPTKEVIFPPWPPQAQQCPTTPAPTTSCLQSLTPSKRANRPPADSVLRL